MKHPLSTFAVGTKVTIRPEFRDAGRDAGVFVVKTEDEGKGRVDISPADWNEARDGRFCPMQVVGVNMISRC